MWYRWTKVVRANIPPALRTTLEEYGAPLVAQIIGTYGAPTHGFPQWAAHEQGRRDARAWLREKYLEQERRYDSSVAMEIAIIVLVAVEAGPTLARWVHQVALATIQGTSTLVTWVRHVL